METNVIEQVNDITVFNDMSTIMQDPDLDEALALVIKLIARPDVPTAKAPELIIRLQAMSAKFAMLARYYTSFEKGPAASQKKNTYYTAADSIDKLVSALKYTMKGNY
jgi:hypothetical protein